MTSPESTQDPVRDNGLLLAVIAFGMWGLFPLAFLLVMNVPSLELLAWRVALSLPVCAGLGLAFRQGAQVRAALTNARIMAVLTISAALIGGNWFLFIYAVQHGHVLATSLGYYITPLVNIVLGTAVLKERLSRMQWIAVALAVVAVGLLARGALDTLWISLALAVLFSLYGLVRKLVSIEAIPGLTIETLIWFVPSVVVVGWYALTPVGSAMAQSPAAAGSILLIGTITAFPLVLFAAAARRMEYSALAFVQFLAPSMTFLLGLFVFSEPLKPVEFGSFILIWTAIAVFSLDLYRRRRAARRTGRSVRPATSA